MGFSEFQRLNKQLSSRLGFGNFEDDSEEEEEDIEDEATPRRMSVEERSAGIRNRWKRAGKKAQLLSRFVRLAEARSTPWWENFGRKGCYLLTCRLLNCSCETAFVYSALGLPWPPWGVLCLSGIPALTAEVLVTHTLDSLPIWKRFWLGGLVRFGVRTFLTYPLDTAFSRKVVLDQSYAVSLASFGWKSWNCFSSHVIQEGFEKLFTSVYGYLFENDTLSAWVGYMGARFFLSVPLIVIKQTGMVSAPDTPWPADAGFLGTVASIFSSKGTSGLFQGIGSMTMLLPPMFGVFVLSQLLTHRLIGKSKKEVFEEQVESVRESLELSNSVLELNDREHLEAIVNIATKRNRILILLVTNASTESRYALKAAKIYAENLDDAIVLVGDTNKITCLRNLVRDTRVPFFLPIVNGSIEIDEAIAFSSQNSTKIFARLQAVITEVSTAN